MRALFVLLAAAVSVSACSAPTAGPGTPDYAEGVAALRVARIATEVLVAEEIARGGLPPVQVAQVRQAEAEQAPGLASLSSASSPRVVAAALADTAALLAALPPGRVPVPVQGALATAQVKLLADQHARENAKLE